MSESLEIRRKRLKFRSWHRGTKEMDLILGPVADRHAGDLDAAELGQFEALLEIADPDLFAWISGTAPAPPAHDHALLNLIKHFSNAS